MTQPPTKAPRKTNRSRKAATKAAYLEVAQVAQSEASATDVGISTAPEMALPKSPRQRSAVSKGASGASSAPAGKAGTPKTSTSAAKTSTAKTSMTKAQATAKANSKPQSAPRPAFATGPSQSDFIGLAVLTLVVAAAIAAFWLGGRYGLGMQ